MPDKLHGLETVKTLRNLDELAPLTLRKNRATVVRA